MTYIFKRTVFIGQNMLYTKDGPIAFTYTNEVAKLYLNCAIKNVHIVKGTVSRDCCQVEPMEQ
jgi:hypothetical protein